MTTTPPTAPVKLKPVDVVRAELRRMEPEFRLALPPHIDPEKFIRVSMTAIQSNPKLVDANRLSLFGACMKAAQDGLLPDGREAAFVQYGEQVQYMPMIAGVLKKIRNSGELSSITVEIIRHGDKFNYWVDNDGAHLEHRPDLFAENRGDVLGAYAVARTKDGAVYVEAMTKAQVEKVREASRAKNNGPWVQWWEEMAKKTVMRRLAKRLPMSSDVEKTWEADDAVAGPVFDQGVTTENAAASVSEEKPKRQSRVSRLVASSSPPPAPAPVAEPEPLEEPPLPEEERLPFES